MTSYTFFYSPSFTWSLISVEIMRIFPLFSLPSERIISNGSFDWSKSGLFRNNDSFEKWSNKNVLREIMQFWRSTLVAIFCFLLVVSAFSERSISKFKFLSIFWDSISDFEIISIFQQSFKHVSSLLNMWFTESQLWYKIVRYMWLSKPVKPT